MSLKLPSLFVDKMKKLLQDDYDAFIAAYDKERKYGLRVNELKIKASKWLQQSPFRDRLEGIPWTDNAFYYEFEDRPGKHPHYHAGLYYIQEPSAMVPVELLDVQPGHRVLDLCAAPGGKSTQIASKLQGKGVLVSNDLATERTKALTKNIELAGIRNAVILNEHPNQIAKVFPQFFDRVLVDAPCSGEGMFRKDESMIDEWANFSVERCAKMQDDILQVVAQMVAPGGKLVYSTCTFSPEENEQQIAHFIATNPDFHVVNIQPQWGWANGRHEWVAADALAMLSEEQKLSLDGTIRLWPHLTDGEGHFVAVLQRDGDARVLSQDQQSYSTDEIDWSEALLPAAQINYKDKRKGKPHHLEKVKNTRKHSKDMIPVSEAFEDMVKTIAKLQLQYPMKAVQQGTRIYLQPQEIPSLDGLKLIRAGWFIGEYKHQKFVPSHPFVMGLQSHEVLKSISFAAEDELLTRYLKGETLFVDEDMIQGEHNQLNGYVVVCVDEFPLGLAKYVDGMLKNELPAGWRLLT